MSKASTDYLLAGQAPELERLQLQSIVWEPAARELLTKLSPGTRSRAADVGCGAMGWLRVLSNWVGDGGHVTGTDVDERMLEGAKDFVEREQLSNVALVKDDLFNSQLPPRTFDLVHSRFQIAPLGRAEEQLAAYIRLLKPGGLLVIEDPDLASWRINPAGPAVQKLIALIERGFESAGGNFNSGRELPSIVRKAGIEPRVLANVVALEPGHPARSIGGSVFVLRQSWRCFHILSYYWMRHEPQHCSWLRSTSVRRGWQHRVPAESRERFAELSIIADRPRPTAV